MPQSIPFYGTIGLPEDMLSKRKFSSIWKKALASYNQENLTRGITTVYDTEEQDSSANHTVKEPKTTGHKTADEPQIVYQISGVTDEGFDEAAPWILHGSLSKEDIAALEAAIASLDVRFSFSINEYTRPGDEDESLVHESGNLVLQDGKLQVQDAHYKDIPITSRKLIDMGFAEESQADDEELAVMMAEEYPDGPEPDDLIDAISDVREDERHEGVFTKDETDDPIAFGQMIEAAISDEDDID